MNTEKLETLLGSHKQYKALSEYIDKKYKLSLNDLAVLKYLTMKHCKDEKVLMQSFLKTAMDELDLSRTKLLVSIRRLIEKERLSKVRSSKDERKIYIYLNNDDISKFNALFEDVEQF
ncbi:HTH-type transcriptional regulator SarX [Staphylococcus aureus]